MLTTAVFLDRDGVLIEDANLLTKAEESRVLDGVPQALAKLKAAGFRLIVVTNQPVVARGLATEAEVAKTNDFINQRLAFKGIAPIDHFYFCPHHPKATLEKYRVDCECRKPRPGMLQLAAREHGIDLKRSFMVGDRITDIIAGMRAGCRTVLVETGQHSAPPIETVEKLDLSVKPDHVCAHLPEAVEWILSHR